MHSMKRETINIVWNHLLARLVYSRMTTFDTCVPGHSSDLTVYNHFRHVAMPTSLLTSQIHVQYLDCYMMTTV
jgi:hypothetical protein